MRAILLEKEMFEPRSEISVAGDKLHHLLNVVRLRSGEEALLLNGEGELAYAKVESIDKRSVRLFVERVERAQEIPRLDIAFAQPKKEALEFCLRASVECGARKVFIAQSERAQSYSLKEERLQNILRSGLEQSNNPFLPEVETLSLDKLPSDAYDYVAVASMGAKQERVLLKGKGLLVVGPEGGFTAGEEEALLALGNSTAIGFAGPILRTQTAIPFFAGKIRACLA